MSAPTSFDEAMSTLAAAIEDTLSLLNPHPTPTPAAPPRPHSRTGTDSSEQAVPVLHLGPGIDPDALAHALRHALYR